MASDTWAQRLIARARRSRWFPDTMVDRVADPADSRPLTHQVVVYFPTAPGTMYQLRQWFGPLRSLNDLHPVVIVCRDSRTARLTREESGLPCISVGTDDQLDRIISVDGPALALYPNLDPLDFDCLRISTMVHAYIGHGNSAKGVFASNQIKAFDRYLVAGEAAIERLQHALLMFDARERCVVIGQPSLDGRQITEPDPHSKPRVVYGPTWEGGQASQMHSSLGSHGVRLMRNLVADGRFDLTYRPHPLTGLRDPEFGRIDTEIRRLLADAGHRVDTGNEVAAAMHGASILIADVSAMISEWLPTGRPLIVTAPGMAPEIPVLTTADLDRAADHVAGVLADPPPLDDLLVHQLAFVEDGAATRAFITACDELIRYRNDGLSRAKFPSQDAL